MAFSRVTEWRAIRLVWSRQWLARYEPWLQLFGFGFGEWSRTRWFYLAYLLLFMAAWAFAMLALLANWTSRLLQSLAPTSPDAGAVILVTIGLSGWALWELYQSSRRSPFVFSPEDALLLCQTPASRQLIALAWFAARWLEVALPGGLVVLVLESGVVGLAIRGELEMSDLLRYALAGLRGLSLVIPWQTAMLALAWAVGAHRLQGDRDRRAWRWAAPLAALLLGMGLLWSGGDSRVSEIGQTLLWPFLVPLWAAFGQAAWLPAMLAAVVLAASGVCALALAANRLNLSRAAQETSRLAAQQQARRGGAIGFAYELARQDRLGPGHAPTRWPMGPGVGAVTWKDVVQSTRVFTLGALGPWLFLLSVSSGAALAPEWGSRVALATFWILLVGQQATFRLKSDLTRWWLWQQLPLPSGQLFLAEMAWPVAAAVFVTWLGLGAGSILAGRGFPPAMWLVPTAVSSVACAAVFAVLQQCHSDKLLADQVPDASQLAFILGLLCTAVPFGVAALFAHQHWPTWVGIGIALLFSLACTNGFWRLAVRIYGRIA